MVGRTAYWWNKLTDSQQKEILEMSEKSIHQAAKFTSENYPVKYKTAQSHITVQLKKISKRQTARELTEEDRDLIARFKKGDIKFDEVQRELAVRVFEKMLKYPDDISVRDYLQSELIKVKKEELNTRSLAMGRFVDSFFGGFNWEKCPHCHKSLEDKPKEEVSERSEYALS